jgi:hypothetical protein
LYACIKRPALQKLLSIVLLFAFGSQCFSQWGVLAGYELNKSYIARVLCVNRDKPAMHCDGKCYLSLKMRQDQQRKDSDNGHIGPKIDLTLFCPAPTLSLPVAESRTFHFKPFTGADYTAPYFSFFHPPRA